MATKLANKKVDAETNAGCLLQIYPLSISGELIYLPIGATAIVGRDPSSTIFIDDGSVSGRHAKIEPVNGGFRLTDLGSTNGTSINENKIDSATLTPGDRVQFGSYIFKFLSANHIELQYHEAVYSMMTRDGLTDTLNKRYFLDIAEREFQKSLHRNTPLSLIMFDIDHFKTVNDTHGHLTGDEILKKLGSRIREVIAEHDIFARYGGEEFVIMLTGANLKEAVNVAERCRETVEQKPFDTSNEQLSITISVGVADLASLNNPNGVDALVKAADDRMYKAKGSGRNCVCH